MADAIPWYKSPQQIANTAASISTAVALFPKAGIVTALGLNNPEVVAQDVTYVFGCVALVVLLFAWVKRQFFSKLQPLTMTQAGANAHPATIATQITEAAMKQAGIPPAATIQATIQATQDAKK